MCGKILTQLTVEYEPRGRLRREINASVIIYTRAMQYKTIHIRRSNPAIVHALFPCFNTSEDFQYLHVSSRAVFQSEPPFIVNQSEMRVRRYIMQPPEATMDPAIRHIISS